MVKTKSDEEMFTFCGKQETLLLSLTQTMDIDNTILISPEELTSNQNNTNNNNNNNSNINNVDRMEEDDEEENNNVDLDAIFNSKPSFPPLKPQFFDVCIKNFCKLFFFNKIANLITS